MADVYQWRRRIQPGYPHALMPVGEQDETEPVITRGFGSSRKKARPKISSYFSHRTSSANHGRSSIWSADQRTSFKETISSPHETWPEGCEPDPDQMMDSMMRTLMAEPYRPLDVKHNSPLLMIFEGFRNLRDENASLMRKLKYEVETRFASHHETERERQRWQQEREEYKAEVKRLELIIAKDKEGMAGVFRARQGSILRNEHRRRTASGANTSKNDPRETVFEFLERTRVEDDARAEAARKAQRGWSTPFPEEQNSPLPLVPLRNRPVSPSQKMAVLSHKFSTTSHYSDLPFDSPPSPQDFTSLSQASMFELLAGRPSFSDTDSSENDSAQQHAGMVGDEDTTATSNIDELLLRQTTEVACEDQPTHYPDFRTPSFEAGNNERITSRTSKTRPESLHLDHARRFSFEYDNDLRSSQERAQQPARSILHRSVSVGNFAPPLSSPPLKASGIRAADSAVSSPVTTPLIESPGLSKIPSPVFDASLARPRREDSSSSFLTAIRASDGDTNHSRGTSRSSNLLESPRLSSRDSVRSIGDLVNGQRHSGRYGSMHDVNNIAVVAARAAAPSNSPKPSAELHGSYRANA